MEEDVGVKAPVTRLRRRLSVEQTEDVSSPATPTKKRGGRLAAKPQLDLIEENAQVSSPKITRRKSAVKDVADAEEKPVTPSRRSTRIKSNSSLVLETLTAQITDSPRAKRALRRTSQAGSDSEGSATPTPARQRRTRKDSASIVENHDPAKETKFLQITELVITEEPENEVQVTANKSKSSPRAAAANLSSDSPRKSKRLSEKRDRRSGSYKSESDTTVKSEGNESLNSSVKKEKLESESKKSSENIEITDKLSESNISLLKSVDTESKVLTSILNKSTSDLNPKVIEKKKRNRTESWPKVINTALHESAVFSDDEYAKKKKASNLISATNTSSSILNNTSIKVDDENKNKKEAAGIDSNSKRRKTTERSITIDPEDTPEIIQPNEKTETNDSSINKEKKSDKPEDNNIRSEMSLLFDDAANAVQTKVYFEYSDSNGVTADAANKVKQSYSEDQCVPVVKYDIEFVDKLSTKTSNFLTNNKEVDLPLPEQSIIEKDSGNTTNSKKSLDRVNDSCEPMDVDETLPEDVLNSLLDSNSNRNIQTQDTTTITEETNKSKIKSLSSISAPDTLDKFKNENKSTLILSQIKDDSATSEILLKSPKKVIDEVISKSVLTKNGANTSNNEITKANLSLNDLKGTPLRQKDMQKLTMQTSTPITAPTTDKNVNVADKRKSDGEIPDLSKSIDESSDESSDESDKPSKPKSKYLDDEAEEASEDYESGDSRDEEERQYEHENEIIEQGETLGSDDDVSNDTDYERDSFIVSSDAEDNELLSGSGEDLSMSDNELTMSKKSKKKFNERKLKEQKNASREMFNSRHKLNTAEPKSPAPKTKSNRMRIDSSLLESDEELVVKPKKGNRLRLDSTLDASMKQEDPNTSNKKANSSPGNQSGKEITICNDITDAKDPLIVELKKEPKTPQKDLNISVVQFTATQEIENVEVAGSNSILNQTETDPLQKTMANGDSDSSESEEILQNYDSVLDELNKNKKLKLNDNNNSLMNIGKKKKNKTAVEPIVDQLNLTDSKKVKKNKKEKSQDVVDSKSKTEQPQKKQDWDSEDESTSIDLQLLFSEDNCGSGDENVDDTNKQQKDGDVENMFIPLKKSPGKTNIRNSMDSKQKSINDCIKKKNRKSSLSVEDQDANKPEMNESIKKNNHEASLTTETMEDPLDSNNPELTTSAKKKKKKYSATEQMQERQDSQAEGDLDEVNKSPTKKDKKRSFLAAASEIQENTNDEEPALNESVKKKKKRKSSLVSQEVPEPEGDFFFFDTKGAVDSDKEEHGLIDNTPATDTPTIARKKKNKKKEKVLDEISQNMITGNDDDDSDGAPDEVSYRSEKACDLDPESQNAEGQEAAETENSKKKRKKKKNKSAVLNQSAESTKAEVVSSNNSKKRKRQTSDTHGAPEITENITINESASTGRHKKKRKTSHKDETSEQNRAQESTQTVKKNKKRKERDEDNASKKTKVSKDSSFQEVHLPPLPASILNQLDDAPSKKNIVISTSKFTVENARQKRAKPSNYLEESVHLDGNPPLPKKEKPRMKIPKVLPFIPTASTSDSGFTTNFKINKLSQNTLFMAEPTAIAFSKERYLQKGRIKKMGSYDLYKKQIHKRLSKF